MICHGWGGPARDKTLCTICHGETSPRDNTCILIYYSWYTPYRIRLDLVIFLTHYKNMYLKFVVRNNSKFPYENNFFPMQAGAKILFILGSRHTWDALCRVWLGLNNSSTRRKRPIFKYTYSKLFGNNRKFPCEILTFFPRQALAKILFILDSRHTGYHRLL